MRIVVLDWCYAEFLDALYSRDPGLADRTFEEQRRALAATAFGTADFYSKSLGALGHEAQDVVLNAAPAVRAWARENGLDPRRPATEIVHELVARTRPDVLYVQELNAVSPALLRSLRGSVRLIAGQTAYPLEPDLDLSPYDVIFTSFPHYVDLFRHLGVPAEYLRLAFEPRILEKLGPLERRHDVVFVGGVGEFHRERTAFLEAVARRTPLEFWGFGVDTLAADSPLRACHRGEAWGLEMFRVLASARIALNRHIAVAGRYANNMRLYEATGTGALLLTDDKENLSDLFVPGREVVSYRSADECVAEIERLLAHEDERAAIARAGQERTLRDHSYPVRMRELAALLEDHLRSPRRNAFVPRRRSVVERLVETARPIARRLPAKALLKRLAGRLLARKEPSSAVSTDYRVIERAAVTKSHETAWRDPAIPARQRALVDEQLASLWRGAPPRVFTVAAEALRATGLELGTILEVGCASGYYAEVLAHVLGHPVRYTGLDYSEPLLRLARERYPSRPFLLGDATRLPLRDRAVDVVISGCVLLHLLDPWRAIAETARVARSACVFHRTPVAAVREAVLLAKRAYGVETVELVLPEAPFRAALEAAGLRVVAEMPIEEGTIPGVSVPVRTVTYACRRT
jgi:SAM-dependent methyltransferase